MLPWTRASRRFYATRTSIGTKIPVAHAGYRPRATERKAQDNGRQQTGIIERWFPFLVLSAPTLGPRARVAETCGGGGSRAANPWLHGIPAGLAARRPPWPSPQALRHLAIRWTDETGKAPGAWRSPIARPRTSPCGRPRARSRSAGGASDLRRLSPGVSRRPRSTGASIGRRSSAAG
jgi:hypothetical protein